MSFIEKPDPQPRGFYWPYLYTCCAKEFFFHLNPGRLSHNIAPPHSVESIQGPVHHTKFLSDNLSCSLRNTSIDLRHFRTPYSLAPQLQTSPASQAAPCNKFPGDTGRLGAAGQCMPVSSKEQIVFHNKNKSGVLSPFCNPPLGDALFFHIIDNNRIPGTSGEYSACARRFLLRVTSLRA